MFVSINSVNALVLQSSFGVTSFVSEVVFLKMPSRQEKKCDDVQNLAKKCNIYIQNIHLK